MRSEETRKAIAAAEQILVRAREATERERARMLAELRREVGRLVVQTTAAVTGKILTPDDQRRLAEETARQLRIEASDEAMKTHAGEPKRAARAAVPLCPVERRARRGACAASPQRLADVGPPRVAAVLRDFQRLVRLDRDRHTAPSSRARRRCADVRAQRESRRAWRASTARRWTPSFAENPALIGGMRIKVGSDVYDGSVRAGWPRSKRAL